MVKDHEVASNFQEVASNQQKSTHVFWEVKLKMPWEWLGFQMEEKGGLGNHGKESFQQNGKIRSQISMDWGVSKR